MADITQDEVDDLKSLALGLAPSAKLPDLETDIKSRASQSLEAQARFLRRVIDAFEEAEVSKYRPEAKTVNGSGNRRPDKSNPWSREGWNLTHQSRLVTKLGEAKAAAIAEAAGCKLGSTRPNPSYN